jgi:alkylhydroperoxidase/carboxymuconolactone decarboxylase family protein YurZ
MIGPAATNDQNDALAGFLDTGLDLTTDGITSEERARTLAWYREHHDHGDLDLAPFARFQLEHDPTTFKRLRRHLLTLGTEPSPPLPIAAAVLLWVHTYAVLGNGKGALYEIVAARSLGATRAQTMETIAFAALNGGPLAVNALAEVAHEYLADWPDDNPAEGVRWPDGWAPDTSRLRSGIDLGSDALGPGELELLRDWYLRTEREVPPYVELLGSLAPNALKTMRARFETAVRGALPAQLIPLFTVHLGAVRQSPLVVGRSLRLARGVGVRRGEALSALLWAAVYGGESTLEAALAAAAGVLEDWE